MNNNIVKFAFVGIACAAFCTATFAAPRGGPPGGRHGGNGHSARATLQTQAPAPRTTRSAPNAARSAPHSAARPATHSAARSAPSAARSAPSAARPATRSSTAHHAAPARPVHQPAVTRYEHARPEPHHHAPPPRVGRHHIPSHARYCARPPGPLWRVGALRAWEWIAAEWMIVVNGVYYYGDGYYYDGYNYYYNGAYHTVPPMSILI